MGVYNPVNVKTGIVGHEGRPNICSLSRLTKAFMAREIDSYWLLTAKVALGDSSCAVSVDLINALDWLGFVSFDSGTGQLMLQAAKLEKARSDGTLPRKCSASEVLEWMLRCRREADARLATTRAANYTALLALVDLHRPTLGKPLQQEGLELA